MDAFFKHMGHTDEVLLEKERRAAVRWVCNLFHKHGFLRSGLLHFEFEVDRNLWYNICKLISTGHPYCSHHNIVERYRTQGVPGPEWPWSEGRPLRTDLTQGVSQVYADFLEEKKAAGAAAASKDVTPNEGFKAPTTGAARKGLETSIQELNLKRNSRSTPEQGDGFTPSIRAAFGKGKQPVQGPQSSMSEPTADSTSIPSGAPVQAVPALDLVPAASSSTASNRMEPPMMPRLELRQKAWEQVFGDTAIVEPVVGPFEIRLPSWLDFQGLVLGSDGMGLHRINNDGIDADLVITWEEGMSPDAKKLIVGFSGRADRYAADRRSNLERLIMLWYQVFTWASMVYQGRPMPLESHLHGESVARMGNILDKLVDAQDPIHKVWNQIQ